MKNCRFEELAELLFPKINKSPEDYYIKYPPRRNAAYRIAPSPTGYLHIGTVGMALLNSFLARGNSGIFYLRIEDTDEKRFVADAADNLKSAFEWLGIEFDEGAFKGGEYGPYIQSRRLEIYHAFAKRLVAQGRAYPCFCSEAELAEIRERQKINKEKTGYHTEYAKCRGLGFDDVKQKIMRGDKWVLRANFSKWNCTDKILWRDGVKGEITLPAEINDPIIIKSNGLPPYSFAHVIDDTLMRTTAVLRGEEWLISTAQHIQLFDLLELPHPEYLHLPTITVEDNGKKRKLSKRKDREALAMNLIADGYPTEAIIEYLLTVYNTDFELWRVANPNTSVYNFKLKVEKIGSNNPMFDLPKFNDISKNVLSKRSCETICAEFNKWYAHFKPFELGEAEQKRMQQMLCVERGGERPRKDLLKFSEIINLYDYMLDKFKVKKNWDKQERLMLTEYGNNYKYVDDKTAWFEKIKQMAAKYGYAVDKKNYKESPGKYKGNLADFVQTIRAAITGRENTPDLWSICQILGADIVRIRLTNPA